MDSTPTHVLPGLDLDQLQRAVQLLRAINHDLRRRILALLLEGGQRTVTEIFIALRIEQSIASQHLAVLRRVDLVKSERDGKYIYYTTNASRLEEIRQFLFQLCPSDETAV